MDKYSEKTNFGLLQLYKPKPIVKDEIKEIIKEEPKKKKKKKKKIKLHKCYICNKKLNITEQTLTCKCGVNFCAKHRLQNQHNCPELDTFDKEKFKKKCGLVGGGKFKQLEVL